MRIRFQDLTKWHRWFAWHPVSVGNDFVWWEYVIRKGTYGYDGISFEYRTAWPK